MKVLILSHMYPNSTSDVFGIFVEQQARALSKLCELKVVSPVPWSPFPIRHFKNKWKEYARIPDSDMRNGIEVYYPRYLTFPKSYFFEYTGWFYYSGIRKLIKKIYKDFKFDVIYSHTVLPDGYGAMLLNWHFSKPGVIRGDCLSNVV